MGRILGQHRKAYSAAGRTASPRNGGCMPPGAGGLPAGQDCPGVCVHLDGADLDFRPGVRKRLLKVPDETVSGAVVGHGGSCRGGINLPPLDQRGANVGEGNEMQFAGISGKGG